MEAQICNLLMQYCSRKLESIYNELNTKTLANGIKIRNIDETKPEPWLSAMYPAGYANTLKQAVLVLRRLYTYW